MVTTNAVRFPFANLLALLLMAGLFTALFNVITAHHAIPEPRAERPIIFSPPVRPQELPPRDERLEPPIRDPLPPIPRFGSDAGRLDLVPIPRDLIEVDPPRFTGGRIDAAEAPLIRINPDYPQRAVVAHLEGWVRLQFTVAPSGAVIDVAVIDADPKGVFDEAATKAVMRWKYAPKIQDGRAVERRGLQVVLRFTLD